MKNNLHGQRRLSYITVKLRGILFFALFYFLFVISVNSENLEKCGSIIKGL